MREAARAGDQHDGRAGARGARAEGPPSIPFIITPEDNDRLFDPRGFTRDVTRRM
ncbi:hypothetical protein QEV83_17225 [Methylocapsa sp. D3K7]|uniref:hypothetical protein n=1 Tax=Methylocapsa sp. D3K7 TaxID=3041435 RepID=UPI00244EEAA1|nr:hypothetical protein [Methylocapsa sp. D3K7]WGJ14360.1 hypothetical protein QEV83_17225 [Methylocapsa sp. D3K7]